MASKPKTQESFTLVRGIRVTLLIAMFTICFLNIKNSENRKKLVRQIQQQERFLDSLVKDSVGRTVEYHEAQKQNALLLLKEHEIREYYTAQK